MDPNKFDPDHSDQNLSDPSQPPPVHDTSAGAFAGGPHGSPAFGEPGRNLTGVRVPMLISGIFHCIVALSWFSTCFLFFLGLPLLVLGIFEIITFTQLGGGRAQQDALRGKSKTFAILDICSVLLANVPSMVCGIIQLVNHERFDDPPASQLPR